MSWQLASLALLAFALAVGFAWYEREEPPARVLALVAALAALAVVGRLAFAAIPNVKPTTDIVLFAGYALGAIPGFAVGAVTAIVSNIFLSQGPWTRVADGRLGSGGRGRRACSRSVLRGREPNRFVLAARVRAGRVCCSVPGWTSTSGPSPRGRTSTPTWRWRAPRCPTTSPTRSETWCSAS